ncbi:P63C domain protein [Serratia ficaria]|uniref:P63C domain-containing protein n=1 Tax=Serratia ficaria TaxID=61651 RepID=UPI001199009B|nr:P63C domain-containing protein [Serratia ficaria]VVA49369.1 P63C domain protein [Serratia ficaria]
MSEDNKKTNGKAKGGVARAKSLTKEQRSEIARKGAAARWKDKPLRATHKGTFKQDFGIDVECYVLDDENKTAVISQRGMGESIGLGEGGSRLPKFIQGKTISAYIGHELREKLENPLKFQYQQPGTNSPVNPVVHGYDVAMLIDLCRAISKAHSDGKLLSSQGGIAKQARIIIDASAKAGIQGLVYALAGYDRTKEEVIQAYKLYVAEEAREYEREFTPELYEHWYRLYGIEKPVRGRPWAFKYLTIDHIYYPLAKSEGKVFNIAKATKDEKGTKSEKIHQFLSEIGVKALRTQIGKVTGIAMVSESREQYEKFIDEKVIGQRTIDLGNEK